MRPEYTARDDGEHINGSSLHGGEFALDEHANKVFCLLQENARLRAHIAKLSSMLKNYLE